MNFFLVILLFYLCQLIIAQGIEEKDIFSNLYEENDSSGLINIYQDYRIENLVIQHIKQNKKQRGIPGYRINIFFESGLNARQQAEARGPRMYALVCVVQLDAKASKGLTDGL